jgi:hypothetical protein
MIAHRAASVGIGCNRNFWLQLTRAAFAGRAER